MLSGGGTTGKPVVNYGRSLGSRVHGSPLVSRGVEAGPRKPTLAFTTLARPIMVVDYEFHAVGSGYAPQHRHQSTGTASTFQTMGLAENCLGLPYDTWDGRKRTLAREFFWPAVQLISHTNRINALRKQRPLMLSPPTSARLPRGVMPLPPWSAWTSAKGRPVTSRTASSRIQRAAGELRHRNRPDLSRCHSLGVRSSQPRSASCRSRRRRPELCPSDVSNPG